MRMIVTYNCKPIFGSKINELQSIDTCLNENIKGALVVRSSQ